MVMIAEVRVLDERQIVRHSIKEVRDTDLPTGGLVWLPCSLLVDLIDSDLSRPLETECSLNDDLGLVALLVPYLEEKLSDGRCFLLPLNMVSVCLERECRRMKDQVREGKVVLAIGATKDSVASRLVSGKFLRKDAASDAAKMSEKQRLWQAERQESRRTFWQQKSSFMLGGHCGLVDFGADWKGCGSGT